MRWLAALSTFVFACAGASTAPQRPVPARPPAANPGVSAATCPEPSAAICPEPPAAICPECPAPSSPYSDTEGWYCIDDPPTKDRNSEFSYCWSKRDDCVEAHGLIVKKRPAAKPCRPQAPAYCYEKYSSLLQHRRFRCAATMEHCERKRIIESKEVLPEDGYVFSPCTEQP